MSILINCKQVQDVNAYDKNCKKENIAREKWNFGINMLDSISTSKTIVTTPSFSLTSQEANR